MKSIEHIGIAVNDLATAVTMYERLLQTGCYKYETVESEGVTTAFFNTGTTKIELLESVSEAGPIYKFLQQRGEGLHHIAFAVNDINSEIQRLKNEGFQFISEQPKKGADNKLVCFIHPRSAGGVLIELCQDMVAEDHSGN